MSPKSKKPKIRNGGKEEVISNVHMKISCAPSPKKCKKFIIEGILKRRVKNSEIQYLIKWEGYSGVYNTWEPMANLPKRLVKDYEAENPPEVEEEMDEEDDDSTCDQKSVSNDEEVDEESGSDQVEDDTSSTSDEEEEELLESNQVEDDCLLYEKFLEETLDSGEGQIGNGDIQNVIVKGDNTEDEEGFISDESDVDSGETESESDQDIEPAVVDDMELEEFGSLVVEMDTDDKDYQKDIGEDDEIEVITIDDDEKNPSPPQMQGHPVSVYHEELIVSGGKRISEWVLTNTDGHELEDIIGAAVIPSGGHVFLVHFKGLPERYFVESKVMNSEFPAQVIAYYESVTVLRSPNNPPDPSKFIPVRREGSGIMSPLT